MLHFFWRRRHFPLKLITNNEKKLFMILNQLNVLESPSKEERGK